MVPSREFNPFIVRPTVSRLHVILPILKLETIENLFDFILKLFAEGYTKRAKSFFNVLTLDEKNLAIIYFEALLVYDIAGNGELAYVDYNEFMQFIQSN